MSRRFVVVTETPSQTFEDEFEMEDDASEDDIAEAAHDVFTNRCSYGFHEIEPDHPAP